MRFCGRSSARLAGASMARLMSTQRRLIAPMSSAWRLDHQSRSGMHECARAAGGSAHRLIEGSSSEGCSDAGLRGCARPSSAIPFIRRRSTRAGPSPRLLRCSSAGMHLRALFGTTTNRTASRTCCPQARLGILSSPTASWPTRLRCALARSSRHRSQQLLCGSDSETREGAGGARVHHAVT